MVDNVPRYKGVCPVCGAVLWISPSIAMLAEWHYSGHGTCYCCKSFLYLEFNPEKKEFVSRPWEEYFTDLETDS